MNPSKSLRPPQTNSHSGPKPRTIRRHCKIARLPADLRERLNLLLRDGAPYNAIIRAFRELGHHLNKTNLSRWHAGGFLDWLREQAFLEEARARLDFSASVLKEPNADLVDQASLRVAVLRMHILLTQFDPATLAKKLAESPAAYVRVLNSLCHLTHTALELRRDRDQKALNTPMPTLAPPSPAHEPKNAI
jgi:hypothetical protein